MAIVICGMRRVGKTFLARDIFDGIKTKNKIFLDLDKPDDKQIFNEESYDTILRNFESLGIKLKKKILGAKSNLKERAYVFIDEIQLFSEIPSIIKYFSDHYNVKFLVTGSSSYYLKNLFSESLSGRKVIFNLRPLDFGEFLVFRNIYKGKFYTSFDDILKLNTKMIFAKYRPFFEEYLETGGFPQVVKELEKEKRETLLKDILHSYLTIDVRSLSDFRHIDDLERLIRILPARIGQKIDYSKISREIGISRITVKSYLRFLKDTFVIDLVVPYSKSADREISSVPKLFFCDIGLGSSLSDISEGQRLENIVHNHLLRLNYQLNYYQKKSGAEIDFIINKQQIGFEVKVFAATPDYNRLKRLSSDLELERFYVLTQKVSAESVKGVIPALFLGFLE